MERSLYLEALEDFGLDFEDKSLDDLIERLDSLYQAQTDDEYESFEQLAFDWEEDCRV